MRCVVLDHPRHRDHVLVVRDDAVQVADFEILAPFKPALPR
jgi:hypothetical protein